eukprot:15458825-Alexandrium_andersonii.AAC.1
MVGGCDFHHFRAVEKGLLGPLGELGQLRRRPLWAGSSVSLPPLARRPGECVVAPPTHEQRVIRHSAGASNLAAACRYD